MMATTERARSVGGWPNGTASALLECLQRKEQALLLATSRRVSLKHDGTLLRVDDDLVAIILDGVAVASAVAPNGESTITHLLGPGSVIGLPVVFGEFGASLEVVAVTDLEALVFRGDEWRRHMVNHPAFAAPCLRSISAELAATRQDLVQQSRSSAKDRIVHRLLQLAEHYGEAVDGEVRISIPLTQEMLGSWARTSRESTAKALHDLRDAGIVRTGRREFTILNLPALQASASGPEPDPQEHLRELLRAIGA
jgi:CRP/FNR family transcriptional regulator, cyclic AMP receptor protein